jgi:hypothetical protein
VHWTSANGDPKLRRKSSGSTSGDSGGGGSGGGGGSLPWGWTRSRSVSEETHEVHWFLYPLAGPTHIDSSPSEMNDPHFHSHHHQPQQQEQREEQSSKRHQAADRKQTNKKADEDEDEDNEEAYDKFDQPLGGQGQGHGQGGVDVWYEQWDELNRASYYYNAATGESQWESPEWVEETDPASGARYY